DDPDWVYPWIDIGAYEAYDDGTDMDVDGISDWVETWTYGSSIDDPDTDGDGMLDGEEVYAGTDLNNSASLLLIETVAIQQGTNLMVQWQSVGGKTYELQSCTDLWNPNWTSFRNAIPAQPPMNALVLPMPEGHGRQFFRIKVE
ncbi:MAG: thrombospondin type 3 repeat-containing protein, partial [Verrucomicrobiota bacterium]